MVCSRKAITVDSPGKRTRVDIPRGLMQDGATKIVEIAVECPKCRQESVMRIATGIEIETLRKSIVCAYCQNPWVECRRAGGKG